MYSWDEFYIPFSDFNNKSATHLKIIRSSYDDGCVEFDYHIVKEEEIENPDYEKQMKIYNDNLTIYKEEYNEYKIKLKEWEEYNKAYQIQQKELLEKEKEKSIKSEKELYEQLKKKYG